MDQPLMAKLAKQMLFLRKQSCFLVAMPEGEEPAVTQTAELLSTELQRLELLIKKQDAPFNPSPASSTVTDEKTKALIQQALDLSAPGDQAKALIVVADLEYAQKMARIILWDFLGNHTIQRRLDQSLSPGEAVVVNCRRQSRDTLHPEGYEAWAAATLAAPIV
ncbi:MAG: hypothetical protein PHS62_00820 [Patescibacteria group bacterium]|nr:hypothetical protein [Patescibacteria group bacterium]